MSVIISTKKEASDYVLLIYNQFHNDDRLMRIWAEENNMPDPNGLVQYVRDLEKKRKKKFAKIDTSGL